MKRPAEVRCLDVAEYGCWDALVTDSPQGTLFHTSEWLGASGSPFRIYGCFKGDGLQGGMAIGIRDRQSAGHPLLTPYVGIVLPRAVGKYVTCVSNGKEISSVLARQLRNDFASIHCRFSPEVVDLQPFIWEGYESSVRYTYRLDVTDLAQVWNNMEQTRRTGIRRAEKDGIHIENDADFLEAFALVEETFERQQQEVSFKHAAIRYDALLKGAKSCRSFLARDRGGEAVGAVYIVWDEKRAYYLLGGYKTEASHRGACALAMWEAIRFTRESLSLPEFDFEGSMIPAVEQFFRKFGGTLTPTYCVSWTKRRDAVFLRRAKRAAARLLRLR